MKKSKLLFLVPLMLLSACGEATTSDVPNSASSEETTTSMEKIDFVKKAASLTGNLKLAGVLSYKFYEEDKDNAGSFKPTAGEAVNSNLEVSFTDTGYVVSYNGDFDENFTETLFKSEDNTVELRYINNNNELTIERPKDKNGNEYDFAPYTNPFVDLSNTDLKIESDGVNASFNLDTSFEAAQEFVSKVTYYTFPELKEVSFYAEGEEIKSVHIETNVLQETLRAGVYTFDLEVVATGEAVTGPVTPEPIVSEDDIKLGKLQTALEEINSSSYEASLNVDFGYGDAYNFSLYKDENGVFCADNDMPKYSIGYYEDQGQMYKIEYDTETSGLAKTEARETKEEVLPPWLTFSSKVFTLTENENEFQISSEISESSVGNFALALTIQNCYEMMGASSFKINLDEDGHVQSLTFVSSVYMFVSATFTITKFGSCEMPFTFSEIPSLSY